MALNEMIAQGAQFKMADPLEQYGRIAQIQQAQNQNALAQYQINSAKRADETNTNFLSSLRAAGDDPAKVRQALMMAGRVKEAGELDASALTRQEIQGRILKQQRENVDRMKLDLGKNPSKENITAYMQDIDADPTLSPAAKAIAKRGLNEMLGMSVEERKKSLLTSGMSGAEMSTAGLAEKKLVAPEPIQITRGDGKIIFVDKNPYSATFKQEILPSQAAGMTPYQTGTLDVSRKNLGVAQGNLSVAQQRLAQDAQGVTYQQDAQGNIIALPSRLASGGAPVARAVAGEGGAPVKGKLSAFAEKTAAQKAQLGKDLATGIKELENVTKDGGLIDQSTGSGVGRLVDVGARFVGQAMPGDIAIGKLKPIADLPLKLIPRFEGPQSDKDTTSYNAAAGQLADPTLPTKIRKEAGKTVLRLLKERQGQFVTSDMATEGAAPAPAAAAGGVVDFGSLR
jgi:hypothetical protein